MRYPLLVITFCLLLGSGCVFLPKDTPPPAGITSQPEVAPSPASSQQVIIEKSYDASSPGADIFKLGFTIPAGMDVEYIPEIEALNIYSLEGEGTTLDRSQIFLRYFDASRFLTLQTVNVYSTTDLTVGTEDYVARRYDIEKLPGIADFPNQPTWRNERHIVTDFRGAEGFTRYYVVAANQELGTAIYETVLQSMTIRE